MNASELARLTNFRGGVMELALGAPTFVPFPSIHRLSRDMIVTEKIDGTNAQVTVLEDGTVLAGSRSRWITPADDNFGFAAWVADHVDELRDGLGAGTHHGEWWGAGIQRRYGLAEKRFSLFNVSRWRSEFNAQEPGASTVCLEVPCCHVVPILLRDVFDTNMVDAILSALAHDGSRAAPGFMKPEGVVVFHVPSNTLYKKTLDKNDGHKSA